MHAGCAPDDTLRRFLAGTLPEEEVEALEAHLDGCARCGPCVLELARDFHRFSGAAPQGGLLARGSTVGRFVILEVLGRGSFGTVYAAYDPQLDRRLALKVLDAWAFAEPERQALVWREARGLARVNHPNVVAIHDAGLAGGVPFVAMESVAGTTLTRWLEGQPSAPEILEVFLAAGRGLAAVHAAGLVHGDFRSDNVLIGADGRVRVTDFGLASLLDGAPGGGPRASSAAADQQAFCLALQRALEAAGQWRGLRSRRTRAVITGALSADPAARFHSLSALLEALALRRRGPLLATVAGVILLAAGALITQRLRPSCEPDPRQLEGAWDEAERADVQRAFAARERPFALDTLRLVTTAFDSWRAQWLRAQVDACVAARGGQAPLLTELRAACLEESRREAVIVVSALRTPDDDLVMLAQQAVQSLSAPSRCGDASALLREPPPDDTARRASMLARQAELTEARRLRDLGRLREARALLEPLLAAARAEGFRPLEARAAFQLGATLGRLNQHDAAVALLEQAVSVGLEAHADDAAAHAAVLLVFEKGVKQRQPEVAAEVALFAGALVERLADHRLAAGLLLNRALVAESEGHLDEALARQQEAVSRFEAAAPSSPALANALLNQGRLLTSLAQSAQAQQVTTRALALFEQTRGPGHPNVGVAANVLGTLALERGDLDQAAAQFERASRVAQDAFGPQHLEAALALEPLARVALARGDPVRALPLATDAVDRAAAATTPTDEALLEPLLTLAQSQLSAGLVTEARATLLRAEACSGRDHQMLARRLLLRASLPTLPRQDRDRLLTEALQWARPESALARDIGARLATK